MSRANEPSRPPPPPRPQKAPRITERGGRTVVTFGDQSDLVVIRATPSGGAQFLDINNTRLASISAKQLEGLTVEGGAGNDIIQSDVEFTSGIQMDGGRGRDLLIGGSGPDQLIGGEGPDVLYGLSGEDRLLGGDQGDYLDGGPGDDFLHGGSEVDQLMGGRGDDALLGAGGDDVLAAGEGTDELSGGDGADTFYAEEDDALTDRASSEAQTVVAMSDEPNPGHSIKVSGGSTFKEQVRSDLDAMRSLPIGRELLGALDEAPHRLTVKPQLNVNESSRFVPEDWDQAELGSNLSPGEGSDVDVLYHFLDTNRTDGSKIWHHRPPLVGLYHDFVHGLDVKLGTLDLGHSPSAEAVRQARTRILRDGEKNGDAPDVVDQNSELKAVGVPYDQDRDPQTPDAQPDGPSENALREQLNLPRRPGYN